MTPLRPTRVLMINDSLNVGGAERVAVDIANSLDPQRFDVRFCSTRVDGPLRSTIDDRIPVTILGRSATWDIPRLVAFARQVRSDGIDVIHSHGRGTLKFVSLASAMGLIDVRHVFHDHFGWLHIDRGAGPGLRWALQSSVDAYVGVDARLCDWAVSVAGVEPDRVHLVRSGVDVERFGHAPAVDLHDELGLAPGTLVLLMVANFRPQKDHPTLFRAIAELPEHLRSRLQLVVTGSTTADRGYHDNCVAMADRLGIGDQVHLLGARSDVAGLLAGADAGVLSSKNETGPLAILEYMAAGLPFVATDTGEIARAVKELDVGFVPPPRDHHEVADALAALLSLSDAERRAMGARGRHEAETRFAQGLSVRGIERIYDELLGTGPSA